MSETNKKPLDTQKFNRVHVSFFANESSRSQGKWYSFSFSRCYVNEQNQFAYTHTFGDRDLDDLGKALAWVREKLQTLEAAAKGTETR